MAKFPSLQNVLNSTLKTILRFPLEILISIIGVVLVIILNEAEYDDPNKELYVKAIMSCSLCLVLFLSVSLFFIATKKNKLLRYLTSIILGFLIFLFIFNFHEDITEIEIQQFIVLNIALHLLVSFAGFLPRAYNQDEFWEFNKQLFLRILTACLYSTVLYAGLALAILAIDELFHVEFYDHIYFHIFFIISGIFNTTFFLSGVPETNNEQAPLILNYPKGLKNFTQYVLLPLISLYLVILICYEAKILVTLSLPVGWVSYLVLVFAIFGILSFLLVHPIATEKANLWIRTFNRLFYFLLVPLLGLLFWAILYRINLYGFTHERYYVLLLSIWLTIVVAYFLIQKQPKIKFIPISMCLAALLSLVGPQSANSISKYSQLSRFEMYIEKGKEKKLTFEQEQDLSSIVTFLQDNYGIEVMIPYAKVKLEALLKKEKYPSDNDVMNSLGFEYRYQYDQKNDIDNTFYYYFYGNDDKVENIHGQDFLFEISSNNDFECNNCTSIDGKSYTIKSKKTDYGIDLRINKDIIPLKLNDFVNANSNFKRNNSNNTNEKVIQKVDNQKYTITLTYLSANGTIVKEKKNLTNYQIKVIVGIKK
jgi:hypothetical protein